MPRSLPLRSLCARRLAKRRPFRRRHAAVHHLLELAGIEQELGRRRIGHRRGRHEIDAADGVGVHAELARRGIDEALEQISGLRPPGAAIGADRHGVGAHALDVDMDRPDRIKAGDQIGRARRNEAAEGRQIGADIGEDKHPQAEEAAVRHRAPVRRALSDRGPDCRKQTLPSDPPATLPAVRSCGWPTRRAPARDRRRPSCRSRRRHWA